MHAWLLAILVFTKGLSVGSNIGTSQNTIGYFETSEQCGHVAEKIMQESKKYRGIDVETFCISVEE